MIKIKEEQMQSDGKFSDLTELIIKSFYKVYNTLGYGFAEKVYANALAIELRRNGFEAIREAEIKVYYEGEVAGVFFADVLVENKVIVETKAKREILEDHIAQLLNYLKSTVYEVGLLLNFGLQPELKRKVYDNERKGSLSWVKK